MSFEELCRTLIAKGRMSQGVYDKHKESEEKVPTAMTSWTILKSVSMMGAFKKEAEPAGGGGMSKWKTASLLAEMAADVSEEEPAATEVTEAAAPAKKSRGWGKMKTAALLGELAAEVHDEKSDAYVLQMANNAFAVNDEENSGSVSISRWKKAGLFAELAAESTDEKSKGGWGKVGNLMAGDKWDVEVKKMEDAKGEDGSVSFADVSSMLIAVGGVQQEAVDAHVAKEAEAPTAMAQWTILKSVSLMTTVAKTTTPEPTGTASPMSKWKTAALFAELAAESTAKPAAGSAGSAIKELKAKQEY
jgi:hypothetical protein